MNVSSCDGFATSVHQLENFLSDWTRYIEELSLKDGPNSDNQLCLKQENDSLKEKLASLQRSLDFQKEEFASLLDYSEKLERLVEQKGAVLPNLSSCSVPMESIPSAHRPLLQHKGMLQSWKEELKALRNDFATSLQNMHVYLYHQLCSLTDTFHVQHREWTKCRQENCRLRRYIQEWKGNLRVVARIRPSLTGKDCTPLLGFVGDDMITCQPFHSNPLSFTFDQIFPPHLPQDFLYEELQPIVGSILDGFHSCIMAYGPTGSGKTFTVFGSDGKSGVVELAIRTIFTQIQENNNLALVPTISMLEIYNETVRDLLSDDPLASLDVREDTVTGDVFAKGAIEMEMNHYSDALRIVQSGLDFRSTSETLLNISSSRSHLLCVLKLRGGPENTGTLYIADLAGSERVTHSHVQGERLDETKHINRSLSCLADVFSALRSQQAHIPYRNSRLTFLLRPALSKSGKAMLIIHVRYVVDFNNLWPFS
ncbi:kinesin family member [Galdieria sulphuraria]|uniref:Kinesin family member n=1 Tax=Galdieria sulphuraria TaxID=130081 RepID=M2XH44_GALSU|nr:kinesin family member [Galdieria sulphuraria]EME29382.1 kinesin family member [Galdieria sulphuraria]|eukprot:XP_005705902.1 kinesin family member [Galdieria sulphuraria]